MLQIKWLHINLIELSVDEKEPCFFLTLKKEYLKTFHSSLGLTLGKYPCYNPFGSGI